MEHIVTEIIEILKSNSDIIEREKQLHAYIGQVACQLIATAFKHIDDALWEEHRREGARSKRRDARTLVTLYGEVTVPRRLVQTAAGRNLYPLDQFLGIAPRSRLSPLLQYVVANVASKTVYRTTAYAASILSNATISHAQVGTVLRQVGAIYRKKEQADAKKLVGPETDLKRMNNTVQVYRKSGQSETANPAKRNRSFSIENWCAVLGTRELPFLEWQLPFA